MDPGTGLADCLLGDIELFPYLKTIKEFIKDCETITHRIVKNGDSYECVELNEAEKKAANRNCILDCSKKTQKSCRECENIPAVCAWLIQSVDQVNWAPGKQNAVHTVNFSEIRAWCMSLCVYMYDVLKPLADENWELLIGLEYFLENRRGIKANGKNHTRVDVMIAGYGRENNKLKKTMMVIELKQYSDVIWSKDGIKITYDYNGYQKTEESPNYQVKYYSDNIARSVGRSIRIVPCVFMHNLYGTGYNSDSPKKYFVRDEHGIIKDTRVTFMDDPILIFSANDKNKTDPYDMFRDHIRKQFDHSCTKKSLDVCKELKNHNKVLSQEELADMLISEELDDYIDLLRPDQHFAMFGFYPNNLYWDNYLKNHIDYLFFFKNEKNLEYWMSQTPKRGIIDVIEGGPGSGKTVLAMLLLRYCLDRRLKVAYVYTGKPQINKLFGILRDKLKSKLDGMLSEEQEKIEIFKELIDSLPKSKLDEFKRFKSDPKRRTEFAIISLYDLEQEDNRDYDVYILDDIHNVYEDRGVNRLLDNRVQSIKDLQENGKLVVIFYDRHQLLDTAPDGRNTNFKFIEDIIENDHEKELLREENAFHLWSMFRCNKNEGYLTWIEHVLGIDPGSSSDDLNLFDFDVELLDEEGVKAVAKKIPADDGFLVLTESKIDSLITGLLGHSAKEYKGTRGEMKSTDENGVINYAGVYQIRGVETDKILVIIDPGIKYENGSVTGSAVMKNRYRVLLTRGLKKCYIYAADEGLRRYMAESLEKYN